jgi:hypothetical protein
MRDLKTRLEKLLADAADCELIGNLAADIRKRAAFKRLAEQYRDMAARIQAELAAAASDRPQQDSDRLKDSSTHPA